MTRPALSFRERVGYGVADFGASLTFVAVNTWLLYFLVNVVGLGPLRAGLVFVAGRVFDALLDPVMGLVSDRTQNRWGRLPYIRLGAAPLGASFALLWFLPDGPGGFALALGAFGLFSLFYTVVQVPYLALTPELAPGYDERTSLSAYRVGFGVLASLLAVALPPVIITSFGTSSGDAPTLAASGPTGWRVMGVLFGLAAAASYLTMAASVREPGRELARASAQAAQEATKRRPVRVMTVMTEVRAAWRVHGFAPLFVLFMTVTVGLMIVNSVLPFYLESVLRLSPQAQPLVLGTLFGIAILAFPLWTFLAARFGKRAGLVFGLVGLSSGLGLIVWVEPQAFSALLALTALAGVGLSAVMLFPWAMLPDVLEFSEEARKEIGGEEAGNARAGLLYALFTFGQKLAGSLGVFANALVASLFGYQAGVAEQSARTVAGLRGMTGPVAALVFLVALLLTLRFPITRKAHEAVRTRLEARAQKSAGEKG